MRQTITCRAAIAALRERTGVVIPAYFAPSCDAELAETLLEDTVTGFLREVGDPRNICLSADGAGSAAGVAVRLAEEYGLTLVTAERNRGKLGAVQDGMRALLENHALDYLAVVDQDGDHFANELLNFVRAAEHVESLLPSRRTMVLGRRISRHRPMGYLRGELEELADRMLLDALQYHAALSGTPLNLQFATTIEEYPDFHSGYKLFSRAVAQDIFSAEVWSDGLSEECTFRHAVESVLTVESLLAGAALTVINRSTIDEQPITAFGLFNRPRMTADKIIWPCMRLDVPREFVAQWLDNHLPRIQLATLAPAGRGELLETRRLVREAFGLPDDGRDEIPRPLFI